MTTTLQKLTASILSINAIPKSSITAATNPPSDAAKSYTSQPWLEKLVAQHKQELQDRREWIGIDWVSDSSASTPAHEVRVLDYACGPGTVSEALLPYATSFIGIDVSDGMVAAYNARASAFDLPSTKTMRAIQGDLASSSPSPSTTEPDFYNFDLAVVGMSLHHFADPALAAKRLVERLKPGTGVLLVTDLLPDFLPSSNAPVNDPAIAMAKKTVAHNGFSEEEIESIFKAAGCVDVKVAVKEESMMMGKKEIKMVLARGRRE